MELGGHGAEPVGALVEGTNSSPRKHLSVLNLRERTEGERDRSPGNAVRVEKEGQGEEQKRLLNELALTFL